MLCRTYNLSILTGLLKVTTLRKRMNAHCKTIFEAMGGYFRFC